MAEFQEEQLFRGAAQAQGFAPQQAFDITPLLRENMGIADTNFGRVVSAKQAELESNVRKSQELYKTLGQFSEKAMKIAETIGSAYIDSQILEGKTKMRSFGATQNYGVTKERQEEYDQTKAALKDESLAANTAALKAYEQGAPIEAVNYIKSLSSYQQIGATEYYLQRKGEDYKAALDQFLMNNELQLTLPNGEKFTPSQIDDDPVKAQIALQYFGRDYMLNEVGIGSGFNPNNVMMQSLYKGMDEVDNTYMANVRRNKSLQDSGQLVIAAEQTFYNTKDPNKFISDITGTYDPTSGRIRNRAEARAYFFERVIDLYASGDKSAKDILDEAVGWDPKGRSFRELYKGDIEGENGLEARFDAIDRKERLQLDEEERQKLADRQRNFEAAVRAREAEGRPFTDDEIEGMVRDAVADTGKDESTFNYMRNYSTQEKREAKLEADELDDLRQRRGYLIESDLRSMSSATYKAYISIVQEDESIAKLPKSFESDANKLITALTNEKFQEQIGVTEKSPEWEDMARRARDKYPSYVQEEIRAGNPPALAQKNALQRLKDNFAAGTYTKDPNMTEDLQYLKTLRTARLTMGMNPKIDEYIFNGTDNDLKRLVDYNEGRGEIPKFYYDMAQGQKNLTAWDIAAAQYRAAGYGELGVHGKKAQFNRLDPAVQSVLTYKPTPNKIKRAQATSFKPQANVQGAGGYIGSSNVVDTGLKDYKGRLVRMAPEAAQQWQAMISAGMPFNSADVTNVYRDEKEYLRLQSEGYNPASGGFHNFGLAIDVHGTTGEWLRKNGAKFGWFPHDYEGTHGGHYEFRGIKR